MKKLWFFLLFSLSVWGCGGGSANPVSPAPAVKQNRPPIIRKLSVYPDYRVTPGSEVTVKVDAVDPEGETLTYDWKVSRGKIVENEGDSVKILTPREEGELEVRVEVSDPKGKKTTSQPLKLRMVVKTPIVRSSLFRSGKSGVGLRINADNLTDVHLVKIIVKVPDTLTLQKFETSDFRSSNPIIVMTQKKESEKDPFYFLTVLLCVEEGNPGLSGQLNLCTLFFSYNSKEVKKPPSPSLEEVKMYNRKGTVMEIKSEKEAAQKEVRKHGEDVAE